MSKNDNDLLERKVSELDDATDKLPDLVRALQTLRGVIQQRVGVKDPAQAAELIQELGEVEAAFKRRDPRAIQLLDQLAAKIKKILEEPEPTPEGMKCTGKTKDGKPCGFVFTNEFTCPVCGLPRHITKRTGGHGGSGIKTSSGLML